jgi:hypothetical protein
MTWVIASGCGARTGLLDDEHRGDGGRFDAGRAIDGGRFDAGDEPIACDGFPFPRAGAITSIAVPRRSQGLGVAIPDPEGVLVTGGLDEDGFASEMAFIDFRTTSGIDVPVAGDDIDLPLRDSAVVYRPGADRVILIGGTTASGMTDAVFEISGEGDPGGIRRVRVRSLPSFPLGPITDPAAIFDPRGERVIVHGGLPGTWALELAGDPEWREIVAADESPPPSAVAMGYDPVLHRAIEINAEVPGDVRVHALDLESATWSDLGGIEFVPSLKGELVWDDEACGFHLLSARRTRCVLEHWILAIEGDLIRTVPRGDLALDPAHFIGASVFSTPSRRIAVFGSDRCDSVGVPNDTAHLIALTR